MRDLVAIYDGTNRYNKKALPLPAKNNGAVGIAPVSYCSAIHAGVYSYILITILP